MTKGKTQQSEAAGDYTLKIKDAENLLTRIQIRLHKHAKKQAQDPTNWGHNGDLGHVIEDLQKVAEFLGGR